MDAFRNRKNGTTTDFTFSAWLHLTDLGSYGDVISKTDGETTVTPGDTVTYSITAGNTGPSDALSATVTDTFPPELIDVTTMVSRFGPAKAGALARLHKDHGYRVRIKWEKAEHNRGFAGAENIPSPEGNGAFEIPSGEGFLASD